MKIIFVINEPIQEASGGYKMVYTYANELAANGDCVTIYYHCRQSVLLSNYKLPLKVKLLIARYLAFIGPRWFELSKKVNRKVVVDICDESIADADVVVATAADTAKDVYALANRKGKKVYFIQGYEEWILTHNELVETYQYSMTKITVSNWLKRLIENSCDDDVYCVLNGINKDVFHIKIRPEDRKNKNISMLYHNLESKGSLEGINVIKRLKKVYPDLSAHLFGVVDAPSNLPEWITYTHNASQNELCDIYNNAMIYLAPSWNEGFGLTGAESMMAGCVLVSTDTDGTKEYASDKTAVLVDIHDTDEMFNKCCYLFDNDEERVELAKRGSAVVTELLDYDKAVKSFIEIIHSMQ